jgi:competence protein CoiA
MQVYSLNERGEQIFVEEAEKHTNYLCLECNKTVRLRGGEHKQLHFYHLDPSPSCRQNGKSPTHLALQLHIQKIFSPRKVLLERQFPSIGRIADCVLEEKKLVFEIQCSFITAAELKKRTQDYLSCGYEVIWILHDRRFNRLRLTAAEAFLRKRAHYYTDFNQSGKGRIYSQTVTDKGRYRLYRFKKEVDLTKENFEKLKTELKTSLFALLRHYFTGTRRPMT